ncbi:amino acid permease [Natrinema caseinilyticum]|uniref:amino acid permease n=1 Tax=Natrinema caseinilyticum TaxID=2961570 RepID=UPI0020C48176|nr:amino acid permease [Natrinema caseinilyticum]
MSDNQSSRVSTTGEDGADFARELTLTDITLLGVGAMIGGSVFVLTGLAAGEAGPALVLAFALNGVITIFTAMTYAELGSAIPEPGGGYLWVRTALGRSQAFISGWMSWFAHAVAGSLYVLTFGSFVTLILTAYFDLTLGLSDVRLQKGFAVLATAAFTYVNYRGTKETSFAENVVTILQLAVIVVVIAAGFRVAVSSPQVTIDNLEPFTPNGAGGVFLAMGLTFIAFEGYEIIVQSGREVIDPRENVPKAVFYSMLIVVTLYILIGVVMLGAISVTPDLLKIARATDSIGGTTIPDLPANPAVWQVVGHLGEFGLAQVVGQLLPYGTLIILLTGILSSLAALNATTFSSSRVGYALGHDHVFPESFSRIHAENQTPYVSVVLSGALIAVMAVSLPLAQVAAATDLMFLLLFLQVNYSMIKIRRELGEELTYGYLAPWFPYVPMIGIGTKLLLAVYFFNYSPLAWAIAVGWIGSGVVVFWVYSRGRIRRTEVPETRALVEERAIRERPYRVLVPIDKPANAERLVDIASAIARRNDGELLLTTIVTMPVQTPIERGGDRVSEEREMLTDAMQYVPDDVPAHRSVTVGRTPGRSIVDLTRRHDSDVVVLGWRGRRKRITGAMLGSTIDHVVENAPCDVIVAKTAGPVVPQSILVPTDGGPHATYAERVGGTLAGEYGADLTLLNVATGDRDDAEEFVRERRTDLERAGIECETAVVPDGDVAPAIVEFAEENDVDTIVAGAAQAGLVPQTLFGDIAEEVGEQFGEEVLMVRKYRFVRSAAVRWTHKWFASRPAPDDRSENFQAHDSPQEGVPTDDDERQQ